MASNVNANANTTSSSDLLLKYIYNNQATPNSYKKADLLKLAVDKGRKNNGQLKLVVDVDSCWDKLVGCNKRDLALTPWRSIHSNLQQLIHTSTHSNLELMFMFNGTGSKTTAAPPAFVLESILLILRSLAVECRITVDHHETELIKFVGKFNLHGMITCNPGIVTWNDALDVKIWCGMKFKGGGAEPGPQWRGKPVIESHELCTELVLDHLKLEKPRFLLLTRLLLDPGIGQAFIRYSWNDENIKQMTLPPSLIEFIKNLTSIDPTVVEEELQRVIHKPELTIREHLSKYKLAEKKKVQAGSRVTGARPPVDLRQATRSGPGSMSESSKGQSASTFSSEDVSSKIGSLNLNCSATDPKFLVTPILERLKKEAQEPATSQSQTPSEDDSSAATAAVTADQPPFPGLERDIDNILSESPYEDHEAEADEVEEHEQEPEAQPEAEPNGPKEQGPSTSASETSITPDSSPLLKPSRKVESVAYARHTAGLMHPVILQLYSTNSIQLPSTSASATVDPNTIFTVIRSKMYATLFNSNHMKFIGRPVTIKIKEHSQGRESEASVIEVGWPIPTVERLWLSDDCKEKRIRAFFSITNSERQSLLTADIVPQRVLVLIVALRCIVSAREPVLRRSELDAFLIQSILVELESRTGHGHRHAPPAPPRALYLVQLLSAALVHLHILNDAVGAPIPYQLFIPSQYFEGSTFTRVLAQLVRQTPAEICGPGLVVQMERLRMAVLDGLRVMFMEGDGVDLQQRGRPLMQQQPPLSLSAAAGAGMLRSRPQIPVQSMFGGVPGLLFSNGTGTRSLPYYAAAAQLHVAGQVVGQWGPNKAVNQGMVNRQPQGQYLGRVSRNLVGVGSSNSHQMWETKKKGPANKKKNKKPPTTTTSAAAASSGNGTIATTTAGEATPPPVQFVIKTKPITPPSPSLSTTTPIAGSEVQNQSQATATTETN